MANFLDDNDDDYPYDAGGAVCCLNCGSDDVCAGTSEGPYCGPCWGEYERDKRARSAKRIPPAVGGGK